MTEDTAQKMLRDARDEALRTGTHVTVFGYRLTVLVVPGVPGTMPRALYYVRGRAATLSDAAAAIAEPAIDATL
jgi:hypothetical protein